MLFVLTGSSASGKTTLARELPRIAGLAVRDFDEIGVPSDADLVWRQRSLETWIQRAVEMGQSGSDLLLTGQSPLGEVLACPSIAQVGSVHVCLVDCQDDDRIQRLRSRDGDRWGADGEQAFLNWAGWMRAHHLDPRAQPEVIQSGSWSEMEWDRWAFWLPGDPRWQANVIDTTQLDLTQAVTELHTWIVLHSDPRSR